MGLILNNARFSGQMEGVIDRIMDEQVLRNGAGFCIHENENPIGV